MSDTDSILREYDEGYRRGAEERREESGKSLAQGVAEGAMLIATMGLAGYSPTGSEAFEAGASDARSGRKRNPQPLLDKAWQRQRAEDTAREKENESRKKKEGPSRSSPSSSSNEGDDWSLLKLAGFVAIVLIILFSVLVTIPIWVGTTAVSVITAHFYARRRIKEISQAVLEAAPIVEERRKKHSKLRVAPEFLKAQIRWNPHLLITTGSGLVYAAISAGLLIFFSADEIVRVLMNSAAVVAGGILAWNGGRKMMEWRISEAVFAARQLPASSATTAAQVAFGMSCAASLLLLILVVTQAANLPNELRQKRARLAAQTNAQSTVQTRRMTTDEPTTSSRESRVRPSIASQPSQRRPAPLSSPTQSVSPTTSRDPIRAFTDRFQDLEARGSTSDIIGLYAPIVAYFDDGQVDRAFIEKDKQDYRSRWINRTESRTGDINVDRSGETWAVTYPTHFRVQNAEGDWIEGDADNSLQLSANGSSFHIIGQQVHVKNRVKGNSKFTASFAAVSADAMSRFINQLEELEKSQQLDAIMNNYASRVKYFDHGSVDHSFIRKDKADYFARWPSISYTPTGGIQMEQVSGALWTARAPMKFHVVNQRGEWIDGDVTQILTVDTSGSAWLITAESGEITRREKGTGLPPTEPSTSTASSGSSQAIGGGAFRGNGTVYKIPDLKNLVGKQLSNAWLYGEFAFEQQQDNVAVCRTAATVLFVGKGTTKVNIEFAGGFNVSDRILASMRDPQLPLTYTLRTAPNNPIRLVRVRQAPNGTLEVFAKSPIRLDMQ